MTQLRSSQNSAAILKISCVFEWRRPWGRDYCLIPSLNHSGPQKPRFFWSALCRHQEAGSTSSTSGPISFPEPSLPWTRLTKVAYVQLYPPPRTNKVTGGRERLRKIQERDCLWPGLSMRRESVCTLRESDFIRFIRFRPQRPRFWSAPTIATSGMGSWYKPRACWP